MAQMNNKIGYEVNLVSVFFFFFFFFENHKSAIKVV